MKIFFLGFLLVSQLSWASTKVVFLGDSLTEGYGIALEKAYPALLQEMFTEKKMDVEVINAGVSGSTSAGGKSRLNWYLKAKPDVLFVALGANDGLRGLKISQTKKNLEDIINTALEKNLKVIVAGMLLPPNYGASYREEFKQMYVDLAKNSKVIFYPFLLDGVGGEKDLNLADGIHPNEKGHELMAKKLFPFLKENL